MNLFTPILVSGQDARTFLQGQLTCDIDQLTPGNALLACCNSAQGRVQAILTLVERAEGVVLLVVPEMAERTILRLRKYVLRAKVTIDDASSILHVAGLTAGQLVQAGMAPLDSNRSHRQSAGQSVVRWHDTQVERYLLLGSEPSAYSLAPSDWLLADLRAGLPQVYPETHESFVAQMLNLDLLGGISFEKGCYTGQEIIARAHFRGAVKRRMFRFAADCAPPAAGSRLLIDGDQTGDVVMAVVVDGGCELLAVVNLAQADAVIQLADAPSPSVRRLSLPYSL